MMRHPLSRFPVAHSGDVAKLRDAVDGMTDYGHAVTRSSRQRSSIHGVVNGVQLDNVSLAYVAYSTPVSVFAPPTGNLLVVVVPLGPMYVEVAGTRHKMTQAFMLPSLESTTMIPDPSAGALVGAVSTKFVLESLETTFGSQLLFEIDLSRPRPIALSAENALRRNWLTQAHAEDGPNADDLLDSLTIGLGPATRYWKAENLTAQHLPSYVLAAVQYLRHNYTTHINLTELSRVVGISSRQLQLAFRAHVGTTANEYLRNIRLDKAYTLLESSKASRVADVAVEVGIPHLGRFAQYFTRRFGILPSELSAEPRSVDAEESLGSSKAALRPMKRKQAVR